MNYYTIFFLVIFVRRIFNEITSKIYEIRINKKSLKCVVVALPLLILEPSPTQINGGY